MYVFAISNRQKTLYFEKHPPFVPLLFRRDGTDHGGSVQDINGMLFFFIALRTVAFLIVMLLTNPYALSKAVFKLKQSVDSH